MSHDWKYRYQQVIDHRYFLKWQSGVDQKTSQYLVWSPFALYSVTNVLHIELIRLLIVACGMLSHSSSVSVRSCWIKVGTGTRCRTRWFRASLTCSIGDMFSFQELCTDHCDMGPCIIMLKYEVMAVDDWHDNGPRDLVMVSLCIQIAICKMQLCSLSVAYACPYHNPPPHWVTLFTTLTSANRSPTQRHTCGLWLWGRLDIPNSLKRHWRRFMVEKLMFHFLATALVDIPAASMPIARSLKTGVTCGILLCDKTAHFRVAFYCCFIVPSTRCTCVMIMLFNQLLDMPHLSGGWFILAKEKCSLTGM